MLNSNLLQGRNLKVIYLMSTPQLYNASMSQTKDKNMLISRQINFSSHPLCENDFDTSSQQCIRAIASERRIMLSSCRTVILQDDLLTPEPSLWRRRLYCSTMKSSDSLEICFRTSLTWEHFYLTGAVLNRGLRAFQVETLGELRKSKLWSQWQGTSTETPFNRN